MSVSARVFAEQGYDCTTMRELSRATGMSLAGMYHYVRGKDELLYLIQKQCFTSVLAGAEGRLAEHTDETAVDRLRAFVDHHIRFFAAHMSEMKVLSHEAGALSAERIDGINALKQRYVDLLVGLVREVSEAGTAPDHVDPVVAAYALFGMMNWIYNWYDPAGPVRPKELSRQFAELFLHGLGAPVPSTVAVSPAS
jgi:TetR/AcrR family transcriptional regulator, cholesterol catabolism regulator